MINVCDANRKKISLSNDIIIDVSLIGARLRSYLQLEECIILHVFHNPDIYKPSYNIYRNIFCHAKTDGSLLWQVQQPYDHRNGKPLEEVFKNIGLYIADDQGGWLSIEENGSEIVEHCDQEGKTVIGQKYFGAFRPGIDRLETMTLGQFPNEYWIDYETGKLEWIAIHQKI